MIGPDKNELARWDAQTLTEAEQIKNDPDRLERAKKAAAELVKKNDEETKAMRRVAGGGSRRPSASQPQPRVTARSIPPTMPARNPSNIGNGSPGKSFGPGVTRII